MADRGHVMKAWVIRRPDGTHHCHIFMTRDPALQDGEQVVLQEQRTAGELPTDLNALKDIVTRRAFRLDIDVPLDFTYEWEAQAS